MSVSDLLQFLAAGRKTGTLKLGRASIFKEIYLEDGLIVGSNSNDPREYFGQLLLHYGKLEESQLQAAMEIQRHSSAKLGRILSEQNFLPESEVVSVLRTRTLEIIYDLFLWEEAQFEFHENEPMPRDMIRVQVEATSVVMDGIYRMDEWSRYRTVIPSERTIFELTPGWTQSLNASKETRQVLYHVEKRMTAGEICYQMHTSLFHACALLFDLVSKDVIRVAGEAPAPAELPSDLSTLNLPKTVPELLHLAKSEMKEDNAENVLAIIHSALEQEPKNGEAHRLREAAEKKFVQQIYQSGMFFPDTVPRILVAPDQLEGERLGPQEGFLLSRVTGESDIESILSICPFREADSLRMIKKLWDGGIIGA